MFQSVLNAISKMRIRIRAGNRQHRWGGVGRRNQTVNHHKRCQGRGWDFTLSVCSTWPVCFTYIKLSVYSFESEHVKLCKHSGRVTYLNLRYVTNPLKSPRCICEESPTKHLTEWWEKPRWSDEVGAKEQIRNHWTWVNNFEKPMESIFVDN